MRYVSGTIEINDSTKHWIGDISMNEYERLNNLVLNEFHILKAIFTKC